MRNFKCTTQVPNILFDELLSRLSFAELKVLLAVNRATLGWVDKRTGQRRERAWLACSRMRAVTGLSKRAITNATAALVRRRLLVVVDITGNELYDPNERRGQMQLHYSLGSALNIHRSRQTSASDAEVDQQSLLIIETNEGRNQGTTSLDKRTIRTTGLHRGLIGGFLQSAMSPVLWARMQNKGVQEKST